MGLNFGFLMLLLGGMAKGGHSSSIYMVLQHGRVTKMDGCDTMAPHATDYPICPELNHRGVGREDGV